MQKLVVNLAHVDALTWPKKCSGCGASIPPDTSNRFDVKVVKGLSALFSGSKPKTLPVRLCDVCFKRVSKNKSLEKFGLGLVLLAIGGPIFISAVYKQPSTPQIMSGAAGSFWIGAILTWTALRKQRRIAGIRCVRQSKSKWSFWFRDPTFSNEFVNLNAALLEKK